MRMSRESRDFLDRAKAVPETDSAEAVASAAATAVRIHREFEESEGSAAMEVAPDGRVVYHAHVTIGGDEYLVSMVPLRLDEDESEED